MSEIQKKSVLVDHTSPGVITRMWFTINGWFWENWDLSKERWPDPTILKMSGFRYALLPVPSLAHEPSELLSVLPRLFS